MPMPVRLAIRLAALAALLAGCGGDASSPPGPAALGEGCPAADRIETTDRIAFPHRPGAVLEDDGADPGAVATLTVSAPSLGPAENVLIVAVNAGSTDAAVAEVRAEGVAGTAEPARAEALAAGRGGPRPPAAGWLDRLAEGEQAVRALSRPARRRVAAGLAPRLGPAREAPAEGSARAFHVLTDLETGAQTTVRATLRRISPHASLYVDDASAGELSPAALGAVADAWERAIHPAVPPVFGAEPDTDGNGRVIVLFSSLVGASGALGYVSPFDLLPDDPDAPLRSNEGEIIYLTTPATAAGADGPIAPCELADQVWPATLAHELQHLIGLNQHALQRGAPLEETWADEGLSMMAQDVAGYGHDTEDVADRIRIYLDNAARFGLVEWGGSGPEYGGVYLFFRYLADRFGEQVLGRLVQSGLTGEANVEAATGARFADLQRDWRIALAFDHTGVLPAARDPQYHFRSINLNDYLTDPLGYHVGRVVLTGERLVRIPASGATYLLSGRGLGREATFTVTSAGGALRLFVVRH